METNERTRGQDTHQEITDYIAKAIEDGAPNFEMPWHGAAGDRGGLPRNARTGAEYNGVNILTLWISTARNEYASSEWATFRQWRDLGAYVRKGEKGSPVVFYKHLEHEVIDDRTGDVQMGRFHFARTSWVFNADQVSGFGTPLLEPRSPSLVNSVATADCFVERTGADIREGGSRAYFSADGNYIGMPDRWRFAGTSTSSPTESYYSVLLHELTHWSGHCTRLNRQLGGRFGKQAYAMEELVAELGAAFLCANLNVSNSPRLDHAAYVANWLEVMKNDKRAIFSAASKAREAVEFLRDGC